MYVCWMSSETGMIHHVSYAILSEHLWGPLKTGKAAHLLRWELTTCTLRISLACALTLPLSACTIAAQTWCVAGDFPGATNWASAMSTININQWETRSRCVMLFSYISSVNFMTIEHHPRHKYLHEQDHQLLVFCCHCGLPRGGKPIWISIGCCYEYLRFCIGGSEQWMGCKNNSKFN